MFCICICVRSELQREKAWSRIHLVPLLLAESDRDIYRREQAALAREKEIMKDVPDWEVRLLVPFPPLSFVECCVGANALIASFLTCARLLASTGRQVFLPLEALHSSNCRRHLEISLAYRRERAMPCVCVFTNRLLAPLCATLESEGEVRRTRGNNIGRVDGFCAADALSVTVGEGPLHPLLLLRSRFSLALLAILQLATSLYTAYIYKLHHSLLYFIFSILV